MGDIVAYMQGTWASLYCVLRGRLGVLVVWGGGGALEAGVQGGLECRGGGVSQHTASTSIGG